MDQQHTSDNIHKALQNMVAQWLGEQAGTQEQMGFVVTDGAANMIKALRDGRFVGVRCSAHVLHLVVKAALEDGSNTGRLPALLESCRQIAGHFHRSVKDSQLLREEQKKADLPEHRLKQDVGTRWNSTLDMLERILEQKKAIHAMSCHHFIGSNRTLGRADWALMEQVVTVLTPFRALTELLSKENASLAEVIPLFTHLSLKLDDFLSHRERLPGAEGNILPDVAALLTRLKKELTRRMEERMDNCPELMLATICDPRIKGKLALRSNSLTAWREQLIARVHERQRKTRMQSQEVGGDSEDELEECGVNTAKITELEQRQSNVEDAQHRLQVSSDTQATIIQSLLDKIDDLENISHHNNLRFVNIPESDRSQDLGATLQQWLTDTLHLPYSADRPLLIERAHRLGRERNDQDQRPRPDYSTQVTVKRKAFSPIFRTLYDKKIKFSLLFPVKLKVTHKGQVHFLNSTEEAHNRLDSWNLM
ncbi:zinc finger BED domain-containing protein 4-like [Rhinophrynus dorsalis]